MNRKIIIITCAGVLLLALGGLWLEFRSPTVKFDRTPLINAGNGLGRVLVDEIAGQIHDRGQIVVVADHPLDRDRDGTDYRWNAFRDELKKHAGLSIAAIEIVTPNPAQGMPGCPVEDFLQILNRHTNASAIIFWVDLPDWLAVGNLVPKNLAPQIFAIDTMGQLTKHHYGGYFAAGILTELIGGASDSTQPVKPKTPREWFDKYYRVYTPANFESLPE